MNRDAVEYTGHGSVSRRDFFRYGMLGAVAMAGASLLGLTEAPEATAKSGSGNSVPEFGLLETTVAKLRTAMGSGQLSAEEITRMYLDRIATLDGDGPRLNSVIEVNPDALAVAYELDAERGAGYVRGPLHGIPILIKDNIATADGMETTAGSLALVGSRVPADAFIVRRLRGAGVVILGKANLSEWANYRSTRSSSGWSGRGGQTLNSYVLDRNPSGSSSGSATAVSASLAAITIGTETDGSIVGPASSNGVVGIKPTVGLVSRTGIVPISHNQDTAGPMARCVADAAALLGAMAGSDPEDEATESTRGKSREDYTRFLDPDGLQGARIGVARNNGFGDSEETDAIVEAAIEQVRQAGAEVVDPTDIPNLEELGELESTVLNYDFKNDLNAYLAKLKESRIRSLEEAIEFNKQNAATEMPYFLQETFLEAQDTGSLDDAEYKEALTKAQRLSRSEGIDAVMDRFRLDALLTPTVAPAFTTDLINGDNSVVSSSSAAAVSGYPSITVPAGDSFGLPVGVSFTGRAYTEPILIKLAYAYEQKAQARFIPRFLPSLYLGQDPRAVNWTGADGGG